MTIKEFKKRLAQKYVERRYKELIAKVNEKIEAGVDEYFNKGYITINIEEEENENLKAELEKKGLDYIEYKGIQGDAWYKVKEALRKEGWKVEWVSTKESEILKIRLPEIEAE